jgi:hypothetical protein
MWDLPEDTYLSHVSKGRLRLRIPSKKRDAVFFSGLQAVLSTIPGLDQVKANPLSGSLLILHSELPEEMASFVKSLAGLAPKRNSIGKPNTIYRRVTGTFHQVNTQIRGFTKNELDVPTLSFIALVAAGLYQIGRKNLATPVWYTTFWYALNIFLKSKG